MSKLKAVPNNNVYNFSSWTSFESFLGRLNWLVLSYVSKASHRMLASSVGHIYWDLKLTERRSSWNIGLNFYTIINITIITNIIIKCLLWSGGGHVLLHFCCSCCFQPFSYTSALWRYGLVVDTWLRDQEISGSSSDCARWTLSPWETLFTCISQPHLWTLLEA